MTVEDFGLDDLNIVAIAPQPNIRPVKRKKNNKYERRRASAQRARNVKQTQSKSPLDDDNDDEMFRDPIKESSASPQESNPLINTERKEASSEDDDKPMIKAIPAKDSRVDGNNNVVKDKEQKPPAVKEEKKLEQKTRKNEEQPLATPPKAKNSSKVSADSTLLKNSIVSADSTLSKNSIDYAEEANASQTSRKRHKETAEEEQEHAKYMAEFHARPMELDRRSGAKSATVVSTESKHLFVIANDWESLNVHPRLLKFLSSTGLNKPTTIQSKTIQAFQKSSSDDNEKRGKSGNVLIHSETGSGKTIAYLLPILQSLAFDSNGELLKNSKKISRKELGTKCLILCPTRELANQTLQVLERLCQACFAGWIVPGGLTGGDSRQSEKARVRKGLAIIVATPGRLLDHLHKTESLLMGLKGNLQWLVLDEADRLLDMGLGDQVRQIVQLIRANEASKSQSLWRSVLVSATVTSSVQALAKERILCGDQKWTWVKGGGKKQKKANDDENDSAGDGKDTSEDASSKKEEGFSESTPRQLAQFHLIVTAKLRLSSLVAFLVQRISKGERTVVFMGTCASVDYHYQLFASMENCLKKTSDKDDSGDAEGLFGKQVVFKLHGSVKHAQRSQTLKWFTDAGAGAILLSTDVAARGLNLEGVDWTVQYDPPCEISDYVHRVGRVARAGKAGHSLLFLLPSEKGYLDVLQAKGISSLTALSVASTLNQAASVCSEWTSAGRVYGGGEGRGKDQRGSRLGEFFSAEVQRRLEDCVIQDDIAAKAEEQRQQEQEKATSKQEKATSKLKKRRKKRAKAEGKLLELARSAFLSFLRAYSTKKEAYVRSIFSARALHLGHIARSFALKEPPKSLVAKHRSKDKQEQEMGILDEEANKPKALDFSRLDDNLVRHSLLEDEDEQDRPSKRQKFQQGGKKGGQNAKMMLLENARKMQNNLMDAM